MRFNKTIPVMMWRTEQSGVRDDGDTSTEAAPVQAEDVEDETRIVAKELGGWQARKGKIFRPWFR